MSGVHGWKWQWLGVVCVSMCVGMVSCSGDDTGDDDDATGTPAVEETADSSSFSETQAAHSLYFLDSSTSNKYTRMQPLNDNEAFFEAMQAELQALFYQALDESGMPETCSATELICQNAVIAATDWVFELISVQGANSELAMVIEQELAEIAATLEGELDGDVTLDITADGLTVSNGDTFEGTCTPDGVCSFSLDSFEMTVTVYFWDPATQELYSYELPISVTDVVLIATLDEDGNFSVSLTGNIDDVTLTAAEEIILEVLNIILEPYGIVLDTLPGSETKTAISQDSTLWNLELAMDPS